MLEDKAKFDLAMNLIDGDTEAIKAHLQSLSLDPVDLDMDEINYSGKSATASDETLIIDDVMSRARTSGIEGKITDIIGNQWDAESFGTFLENDVVRNDLLRHVETGVFDTVTDRIHEMKRQDYNGSYTELSSVDQYREAVKDINRENKSKVDMDKGRVEAKQSAIAALINEKTKITDRRKETEFKNKARQEEQTRMDQRKKATTLSKQKSGSTQKTKAFDPMELEGDELLKYMELLKTQGI